MYYIGSFIPRNACNPHHNSVRQTLYDQNFVDDCWNSVCLGNIFPYIHKQKKARILKQDALIIYIYALSQILLHGKLLQGVQQSAPWHTVGPACLCCTPWCVSVNLRLPISPSTPSSLTTPSRFSVSAYNCFMVLRVGLCCTSSMDQLGRCIYPLPLASQLIPPALGHRRAARWAPCLHSSSH